MIELQISMNTSSVVVLIYLMWSSVKKIREMKVELYMIYLVAMMGETKVWLWVMHLVAKIVTAALKGSKQMRHMIWMSQ
jgi:hypothetical protein